MNPYDSADMIPEANNGTPDGRAQMIADLEFCFEDPRWFSLEELKNLKKNFDRLVRGRYHGDNGTGCIFGLLTANRSTGGEQIDCREKLTRFFTGGSGADYRELEIYQPARWLVRAWDCQSQIPRYEGAILTRAILSRALCKAITLRSDHEKARVRPRMTKATRPQLAAV